VNRRGVGVADLGFIVVEHVARLPPFSAHNFRRPIDGQGADVRGQLIQP
jgi:hypothetical protein